MITKNTKKPTKKTTAKTNGYDLNNIKTKKKVIAPKQNGALHGFFSLMGVIIGIGSLMALIVPMVAHAKQGVYIVEPFSCEVSLADKKELLRSTKEDNSKLIQIQLEESLKATLEDLAEHAECEVK